MKGKDTNHKMMKSVLYLSFKQILNKALINKIMKIDLQ